MYMYVDNQFAFHVFNRFDTCCCVLLLGDKSSTSLRLAFFAYDDVYPHMNLCT